MKIANYTDKVNKYLNPVSPIFSTPFQNCRYKSDGEHWPDGNWAIGKRKPQSLMKMNCSTCVASDGSVFPENKAITQERDKFISTLKFCSKPGAEVWQLLGCFILLYLDAVIILLGHTCVTENNFTILIVVTLSNMSVNFLSVLLSQYFSLTL